MNEGFWLWFTVGLMAGWFFVSCAFGDTEYYDYYYWESGVQQEWEENHSTEVYIYETGETIDVGDPDIAEDIVDYGYGEYTIEPPEPIYYEED